MIFVTVGASQFPFDRLLLAVDQLDLEEEVVVQHGPSVVRPLGARCVAFLPFPEVSTHVREARLVISHAGIGSVLTALGQGKRPLVVPRRRAFGETTDDHQVESAHRLATAGLVTAVDDPLELASALRDLRPHHITAQYGGGLVDDLRGYVHTCVGGGNVSAAR